MIIKPLRVRFFIKIAKRISNGNDLKIKFQFFLFNAFKNKD
jgi:hypothetical protein